MSKEICYSCSERDLFGFRPKKTFEGYCTCSIQEEKVVNDFVKRMQNCDLFKGYTYDKNIPPRKQIADKLREIPRNVITDGLENPKILHQISNYVYDTVKLTFHKELMPWEYLDVGCGTGRISRMISAKLQVMTQCTDVEDNRIGKYTHNEYEDFRLIDEGEVPHQSDTYLVVTCLMVFHHAENPGKLLDSIYRVVKPGGILIIREFDCQDWEDAYSLDFSHQVLGERLLSDYLVIDYGKRKTWRKLVEKSGFMLLRDMCSRSSDPYQMYYDVFQKPVSPLEEGEVSPSEHKS